MVLGAAPADGKRPSKSKICPAGRAIRSSPTGCAGGGQRRPVRFYGRVRSAAAATAHSSRRYSLLSLADDQLAP
jgi:hypothetical protein